MKDLLSQLLAHTGVATVARVLLTARARFVLELHGAPDLDDLRLRTLPEPLRPCLTRSDLRTVLRWVARRFQFLTPEEFFAADTPGVLLTFDDGFANQARVVSLLEEFQSPAIVFVTTQHVERPTRWLCFVDRQLREHGCGEASDETLHEVFDGMSIGELAALAAHPLVTIGSHTLSHPFLSDCDDVELARELSASKAYLERHTGQTVDLLAYPTGDYDARVAAAARDAGYRAAFVEDSRKLADDEMEIPRVGLYRADSPYLAAKLSGLHRRPLPLGDRRVHPGSRS